MIGIEAKKIYNALRIFEDPFKYNFSTRLKEETFDKDPLKWQFAKIEKEFEDRMDLVRFMYPAFFYDGWSKRPNYMYFEKYYKKYMSDFVNKSPDMIDNIDMKDMCKMNGSNLPEIYVQHKLLGELTDYEAILVFAIKGKEIRKIPDDFPMWHKYKVDMMVKARFLLLYLPISN